MADAHDHDHAHGHGHDPNLAHHFDTMEQQFESGKLGMWVFLATEILMFGGLFCAYAIYRGNNPDIFLYAHQALDTNWGAINTVVLLASSFTMALAVLRASQGKRMRCFVLLVITFLGGCGFMVIKGIEYKSKFDHGLLLSEWNAFYPNPDGDEAKQQQFKEADAYISKHGKSHGDHGSHGSHGKHDDHGDVGDTHGSGYAAEHGGPLDGHHAEDAHTADADAEQHTADALVAGAPNEDTDSLDGSIPGSPARRAEQGGAVEEGDLATADPAETPELESDAATDAVRAAGAAPSAPESDDPASVVSTATGSWAPAPPDYATLAPPANASTGLALAYADVDAAVEVETEEKRSFSIVDALSGNAIPDGGHTYPGYEDLPELDQERLHIFFQIYFLMTGLHGLHVVIGMGLIAWVAVKCWAGAFTPTYYAPVDIVGLYWHLVDLIWIFLFPLLYLIH